MIVMKLRIVAILAIAFAAGCGESNLQQPTFPVSGTLTYEGQPVAGATIVFHPTDKSKFKWDERPQAKTDADGKFTVFTYKPGDGAPAGDYKVAVALIVVGDDGDDQVKRTKGKPASLPAKYADPAQSGLTATVSASTSPVDLKLVK
jgi:hypothetical protein